MDSAFVILSAFGAVAAIVGVVRFTEGRAAGLRILFGLLAVSAVGGVFFAARPAVQRLALQQTDDHAWSVTLDAMVARHPALKPVLALEPALAADLRVDLLPIVREHRSNPIDPVLLEAIAKAAESAYRTKVMPRAIQGSDEAIAAWGATTVPVLQAFKRGSDEACADYALTGANRASPSAAIDAALAARERAVAAAYASGDAASKPPSGEELGAAYEQARGLAQPPFDDADMGAFRELKSQPKARQCDLMLRLFGAIDRLPLKSRAAIYRTIMANG